MSMVAALALLITWVVTSGGGGSDKKSADGSNGKNPTASITPGPSGSDPAISQAPGGRDESNDGSNDGSGDGGGDGSGGSGGSAGSGDSDGAASGGSTAGGGGVNDGKGGGSSVDTLPAGSTLRNCTAGFVKLTLRSVDNAYSPDEKPTFELITRNSSGSDCKLDLGPKNAVLTITQASGHDEIWSSADCPTGAADILLRIPADGRVTHTVEWNRKPSAPECGTPPTISATPGTYLVEAKTPGFAKTQTSFVLNKD